MKFYRIDWPAPVREELWSDWSTSWDEAHRIGRAQSDYYTVSLVEVPDKKAELLVFLKAHIRSRPVTAVVENQLGISRQIAR